MKMANFIHLRVFSKEGEDNEQIISGLKNIMPFDFEKEKIVINSQTAIGFNETKIKIYSVSLSKERHITFFLKTFMQRLTEQQKDLLKRQKESRLDSELNFFLRIDKQKLLEENIFWITDSGNCYHLSISIAAFPKKREVGLGVVQTILQL